MGEEMASSVTHRRKCSCGRSVPIGLDGACDAGGPGAVGRMVVLIGAGADAPAG